MKTFLFAIFCCCFFLVATALGQSDDMIQVGYFDKDPMIRLDSDLGGTGFVRDLFDHIASENDLKFEYIHGSLPECLQRLENGEIDLIPFLGYSAERDKIFDYSTENVLRTWGRVFAQSDQNIQSIPDLDGNSIGYLRNSIFKTGLERLLVQFGIAHSFVEFESNDDLFAAIENREVDAGIADRLLSYNISSTVGVQASPIVFNPFSLKSVVPEGDPLGLLKIIDTELNQMKADQGSYYYRTFEKWFGGHGDAPMPRWLIWGIAVLLLIVVLSMANGYWLRLQIRDKTRELAQSREDLRITLNSIGDAVISTDKVGRIIDMNPVAQDITAWTIDKARGIELGLIFNICDEKTGAACENPFDKVMELCETVVYPDGINLESRDGVTLWISLSGAPIYNGEGQVVGTVLVFRDITQQRIDQQEADKVRKLESVGILAGGIAHDFNNILTAINGNISLACDNLKTGGSAWGLLEEATKATERAQGLTQQLLTFAKGGEPIRKTEYLRDVVLDSAEFILSGSNVKCEYGIADDLWTADIDKGQFSQVIQNIVLNGRQAMSQGGWLKISSSNISESTAGAYGLPGSRFINIRIEDEGIGIPEQNLGRIFDPYFSSKKSGSGLGLAVCYSIIKAHGGLIRVKSEVGRGTVFDIFLPASVTTVQPTEETLPEFVAGHGQILIMDDEEVILRLTTTILERNGYEVLQARDGHEAVRIFKEAAASEKPIDLVISDLTVPGGMGGLETMPNLLAVDPEVAVIVSSGYSSDPALANFAEYGFKAALSKPFSASRLLAVVQNILQ